MASFPPPLQILLISYFNPNNFINASSFDYTITDTRYLKKNGDTSYGTIIAPNFTGLASNSTNINLTNETLQNSGCLIPFSITATGNQPLKTNSSLKFNPNSGTFTTDFISTTGSITSTSGMTSGGLLTANSGIACNGNFRVSSNLLLQSDPTTAYIRPTLTGSTLYMGVEGTNYFSISPTTGLISITGTGLSVSGTTIASGGLTIGASNYITLGGGTGQGNTQIGYSFFQLNPLSVSPFSIAVGTPANPTSYYSFTIPTTGIWLINLRLALNTSANTATNSYTEFFLSDQINTFTGNFLNTYMDLRPSSVATMGTLNHTYKNTSASKLLYLTIQQYNTNGIINFNGKTELQLTRIG